MENKATRNLRETQKNILRKVKSDQRRKPCEMNT